MIENPKSSIWVNTNITIKSRMYMVFILILIILSSILIVLETIQRLKRYAILWKIIESMIISWFTIEYFLRLYAWVDIFNPPTVLLLNIIKFMRGKFI